MWGACFLNKLATACKETEKKIYRALCRSQCMHSGADPCMCGPGAPLTTSIGLVTTARSSLPLTWDKLSLKSLTFSPTFVWKWTKGSLRSLLRRGGDPPLTSGLTHRSVPFANPGSALISTHCLFATVNRFVFIYYFRWLLFIYFIFLASKLNKIFTLKLITGLQMLNARPNPHQG